MLERIRAVAAGASQSDQALFDRIVTLVVVAVLLAAEIRWLAR